MTTTTIELAETCTNESGTWGWTEDGQLHCTTCHGTQRVPCPHDKIGPDGRCTECDTPADERDPKVNCPTCER